jgi:hypothetical protein
VSESPREEELEDTAGGRWERAGRQLLGAELSERASELNMLLREKSETVHDGEELAESDIRELRVEADRLRDAVKLVAEVSPEAEPRPDVLDVLGEEAMREYARASDPANRESRDRRSGGDG